MKKILFFCLVLLLSAAPSLAKFDPSFRWTTLETPHFLIHYHQGEEEIAKKAAVIAEDVHSRLTPRIKWEPAHKTHLVLVDSMDEANGFTSPFPYDQIIIFLTHPLGEPGFGTISYDGWLRLVITHEYTHALQLDMVRGIPETLRHIFGRIYFPNLFQPVWMIEGLAVYEESEQTAGGRNRSPGADMILRMAALDGPFPSLSQMSVYLDSWPAGQVPYLFGGSFTQYIAEKYGKDKLAEISIAYSGRGVPFLVTSTGKRVLHETYDDLWYEWKETLKDTYRKQEQEVKARGLTVSAQLTTRGYYNISPSYSPDGRRIAYSVLNADGFPGIYIMNADGREDHKLVDNVFSTSASGASPAWSPDGQRLYYTKIDFVRNTDYYNDIFYYDMKEDKEVRVTHGLRLRDPGPSPDGKKLAAVENRLGKTAIVTLEIPPRGRTVTKEEVTYLTAESDLQYANPRWSPDGTKMAVVVWQPGGDTDIWILDGRGKKIDEISHDRAIDGAPAWSPDGKYIYFASDRTGIFNLYAYELETKSIFQITNVLGGAFTPSPSPDGTTIVFSSYSAHGFDIHTLPVNSASWKAAEPYHNPYPAVQYEDKPVETSTRPYSPLSTVYPHFWLPWFGYSYESGVLGGFFTFGQDVIQRHQYYLTALYGPKKGRTWYSLDYFYDGLYPTFHIEASDTDVTYGDFLVDPKGSKDYVEREETQGVSMILPLIKNEMQHSLTVGYRRRYLSHLTALPPWPGYSGPIPAEGTLASARLSYLFNDSHRYPLSISPEAGRTIEVGAERFDRSLGSDFNFTKYTADWHEYIDFPWKHHVLQVRAFAGTSTGEAPPQGAFQLGGDNPGDITLTVDDQTVYLRGYPANAFRGRKAGLISFEYRFPVENIEEGWDSKPVFFRRLHGAVFYEAGNAWNGTFHSSELKRSVGAEARFDLYLAYYLPVTFRLGIAKGLDEKGETLTYIGLWVPVTI